MVCATLVSVVTIILALVPVLSFTAGSTDDDASCAVLRHSGSGTRNADFAGDASLILKVTTPLTQLFARARADPACVESYSGHRESFKRVYDAALPGR